MLFIDELLDEGYLVATLGGDPVRVRDVTFRRFLTTHRDFAGSAADAHWMLVQALLRRVNWIDAPQTYLVVNASIHLSQAILAGAHADRRIRERQLVQLLTDLLFLEARVRFAGIDSVISELRTVLQVVTAEPAQRALLVRRIVQLDAESVSLQGWNPDVDPGYFAQQMLSRAAKSTMGGGRAYTRIRWR